MSARGTGTAQATHPIVRRPEATLPKRTLAPGWITSGNKPLVVLVLILSDVLLALALWLVALIFQGMWDRGNLTTFALASNVPDLFVWVGLRSLLGLYPGYGLGQVEELRRHTFALLTTVAITMVFALASQVDDSLSGMLLFGWAFGLL